ncbi:MAG TPA: M14 family zinc carboxypeptidase, partial [Agromyces sp.]
MTISTRPPSRRRRTAAVLAAGAAFAIAAPFAATAPAVADATFPSTEGNTNTASILTYADLVAELDKLERTSRFGLDVSTLAEVGTAVTTSEQGRDLYVATVGDGPEAVWLQGRIHGNEPYGVDSLLAVLKELGTNGSPDWKLLRETYTFHVIPMYNPDGSELNIRHTILQDG